MPCTANILNSNDSKVTRTGCACNKCSAVNSSCPAALPRFRSLRQSTTNSTLQCSSSALPACWQWNLAFNYSWRDYELATHAANSLALLPSSMQPSITEDRALEPHFALQEYQKESMFLFSNASFKQLVNSFWLVRSLVVMANLYAVLARLVLSLVVPMADQTL